MDRAQNVGHFFMAMKPGIFVTEHGFRDRMDTLIRRVKTNPLASGFDEILIPGEIEARLENERRKTGIPYALSDLEHLAKLASDYGVPQMKAKNS